MTNQPSPAELLYAGIQLTRPLLRNIAARVEADLSGTGISVGQRAVMEVLLNVEQATAPEITEMLQVKRQLVARLLQEMLARQMVETLPNPRHRRSHFYRLTTASRKQISEIRAREMTDIADFAQRFSDDEIRAFHRIQSALNQAFAPYADRESPEI